jgi:tRNA threonylcarbamoyladenosine biosynthesis protein TsaE
MEIFKSTFSLNEIENVAGKILNLNTANKIFFFEAPMSAGKTTLIKEMCKVLGSNDNFSSPTYGIVNEYKYPKGKIYHFDFYRLEKIEEIFDIGFDDYLNSTETGNTYCFIEWPDLVRDYVGKNFVQIEIKVQNEAREISIFQY